MTADLAQAEAHASAAPPRLLTVGDIRRAMPRMLVGLVAVLALVAVAAPTALATKSRPYVGALGGLLGPTFTSPQNVAVDSTTHDVYVIDNGTQTVSRWHSDGTPSNFTALGTNVLNGSTTPAGSFSFAAPPNGGQVAIARSGGPTNGSIFVTDPLHGVVDVFDQTGAYTGQLTASGATAFGEPCGVAVDAAGALYVGDRTQGQVHKFLPSASPPLNTDWTANFTSTNPCQIAPGAGPTAGFIFVLAKGGAAQISKRDAATGVAQYTTAAPLSRALAVDATNGHLLRGANNGGAGEYDVAGVTAPGALFTFGGLEGINTVNGVGVDASSGRTYVSDNATGKVHVYGPLAIVPNPTTGSASAVEETTATVAGTVNPDGSSATCEFEYGTTAFDHTAPCDPAGPFTGSTTQDVSANLTGLQPNATYKYRLAATSADGTARGDVQTFSTAGPPVIEHQKTFHAEQTTATIGARLYSGQRDTTYHFEWGTDDDYGHVTPVPDGALSAGADFEVVQASLAGLQRGTTYHWRLVAENVNDIVRGPDQQFSTEQAPSGDGIPRPPGAIENRGYELVSLPDKNSNQTGAMIPSADGDGVLYGLFSGGAAGATAGVPTYYAHRTATGWVSQNAMPPRDQMPFSRYLISAVAPDLSHWIASAKPALGGSGGSLGSALARIDNAGGQQLLRTFPMTFHPSGISVVASDDLSHVFAGVPEPIVGSHVPGTNNVYDFGSGAPVLVSAMPGTGLAPSCGVTTAEFPMTGQNGVSEHWTSTNGAVLFFATRGNDCDGPRQLYMRDTVGGTTTPVSGPPVGGAPDLGVDGFLQAAPGGSQVFFRADTSYTADDGTDGDDTDTDIYRWSAANGAFLCVTCAIPQADVPVADSDARDAVVAQDGSRVYFPSTVQAAEAPQAGDGTLHNLYVWRADDDSVHYIGQTRVGGGQGLSNLPGGGGQATPDGAVFVFRDRDESLDALSGSENGGFFQYYRYDDRDQSLTCISCPLDGPPSNNVPAVLLLSRVAVAPDIRALTDDGSTVFFTSREQLVPADVNGASDIYEWHNGVRKLITSGRANYPQGYDPLPLSVSADGRDFFFEDLAQLTPDAQDGSIKIYNARIDGGFPPSLSDERSACTDDSCQGPPSPLPSPPIVGTLTFSGSGNMRAPEGSGVAVSSVKTVTGTAAVLKVKVPAGGRITISGSSVRRVTRSAARAATLRLRVALSVKARRALKKRGKLRVSVRVAFRPSAGTVVLKTVTLAFKQPGKARKAAVRAGAKGDR